MFIYANQIKTQRNTQNIFNISWQKFRKNSRLIDSLKSTINNIIARINYFIFTYIQQYFDFIFYLLFNPEYRRYIPIILLGILLILFVSINVRYFLYNFIEKDKGTTYSNSLLYSLYNNFRINSSNFKDDTKDEILHNLLHTNILYYIVFVIKLIINYVLKYIFEMLNFILFSFVYIDISKISSASNISIFTWFTYIAFILLIVIILLLIGVNSILLLFGFINNIIEFAIKRNIKNKFALSMLLLLLLFITFIIIIGLSYGLLTKFYIYKDTNNTSNISLWTKIKNYFSIIWNCLYNFIWISSKNFSVNDQNEISINKHHLSFSNTLNSYNSVYTKYSIGFVHAIFNSIPFLNIIWLFLIFILIVYFINGVIESNVKLCIIKENKKEILYQINDKGLFIIN